MWLSICTLDKLTSGQINPCEMWKWCARLFSRRIFNLDNLAACLSIFTEVLLLYDVLTSAIFVLLVSLLYIIASRLVYKSQIVLRLGGWRLTEFTSFTHTHYGSTVDQSSCDVTGFIADVVTATTEDKDYNSSSASVAVAFVIGVLPLMLVSRRAWPCWRYYTNRRRLSDIAHVSTSLLLSLCFVFSLFTSFSSVAIGGSRCACLL